MAKDRPDPVEPHHLLQDKPEGSPEKIERELKRQETGEAKDGRKSGPGREQDDRQGR